MDLNPLIVSFLLFTAMELGDKTQVAIVAISMRDRPLDVFAGAIAAFAIVDGASIALGGFLASLLSPFWVNLDLRPPLPPPGPPLPLPPGGR
jgi:putative Ca2+/H+ antiporter (TMEM165/GDT1 family)